MALAGLMNYYLCSTYNNNLFSIVNADLSEG